MPCARAAGYSAEWKQRRQEDGVHQEQGEAQGCPERYAGHVVYVADWGNERVSVFSALGFPLTTMIGDSEMSTWGTEYLAANPDLLEGRRIMHDGTPEKRLHGPTAVEVDGEGRVIIVDSCRHRLQVYERA